MDGLVGFVIKRNGNTDVQTYYYRKNIQDDVTHITDVNGVIKAEYVYDAWGNHVVTVNVDGVGTLNPFRYRSYYYDNETSLYYLKSRYYDPETGRFINADDVSILNETQTDINGLNLYMYCANNPVMFFDPTGRDLWDSFKKFVAPVTDFVSDNIVSIVQIAAGTILIATGVGAGLGAMLIISGVAGMALNAAGSQIGGGIGSMINGGGAFSTGFSLSFFGPIGMIVGGALMLIGAATMVMGANEITAGITGTNYIQQLTGMNDSTYGSLYLGLNIASAVGTVGGRLGMRAVGTKKWGVEKYDMPYSRITSDYRVVQYNGGGRMSWSIHNTVHGISSNPHWHTEIPHSKIHYKSYFRMIIAFAFKELLGR